MGNRPASGDAAPRATLEEQRQLGMLSFRLMLLIFFLAVQQFLEQAKTDYLRRASEPPPVCRVLL